MGRAHGRSGGGIEGKNVAHTNAPKQEPRPHGVSVGAVSRLGGMVGEGTPYKALYNKVAYTTPNGPTGGNDCRPGGNGRQIMRAGSQAPTPRPRPLPRGEPEF
jgi:hypothetical protein